LDFEGYWSECIGYFEEVKGWSEIGERLSDFFVFQRLLYIGSEYELSLFREGGIQEDRTCDREILAKTGFLLFCKAVATIAKLIQ